MTPTEDWNSAKAEGEPIQTGMGPLRITLLFGSAAIALALLIAPFAEKHSRQGFAGNAANLDRMSTGSISGAGTYTIRRSVLQSNPNSVCIIRPNGTRSGDC